MIPAMIASLRHILGWLASAFRSREDLVLENLALRGQLSRAQRFGEHNGLSGWLVSRIGQTSKPDRNYREAKPSDA
jgi:hypothetical protein